jgi:hypothetical protein
MFPENEPGQPRGRSISMASAASETSQRTTRSIPGAFEGDTTIIHDSMKERQRGLGQTEPTESELSLRERLSHAQEECAKYKEYARQLKYKQGQYAHRLIQAEERLTVCTTEKNDLEEQVTELRRHIVKLEGEISQTDDIRFSALPHDQLLATLQQENAQKRRETESLQRTIRTLQQELREPIPTGQPTETSNVRLEDIRDGLRHELRAEFNEMLRNHREATAATTTTGVTSATGLSEVALLNYRPRAEGPKEPIDGTNVQEYHSWRYAIDHKVEEDAPYYSNDKRKVAYALKKTKSPLFTAMQNWVTDSPAVTYEGFMKEVEIWMGVHLELREAKKELRKITQKQGETISAYFHPIHNLWVRAKIPEDERIEQLLTTALPYLANGILSEDYISVRDLFEKLRKTEARKSDQRTNHPRTPVGKNTASNYSNAVSRGTTPVPRHLSTKQQAQQPTQQPTQLTSGKGRTTKRPLNSDFGPVSQKPDGWQGKWHDPETKPKRLTIEERTSLQREGRCWACRGSGHLSSDTCCPFNEDTKLLNNLEVDGSSDSDLSEN